MANNGDWIIGQGSYTEYRYRKESDKNYIWNVHQRTDFLDKWGIRAVDLAEQEGVHTATIHMRVQNYQSPYVRKAKPSLAEKIHNKTEYELACELNMHPQSVRRKLQLYGDAYYVRYHMIKDEQGNRTIRCKGDCNFVSCKNGIYEMPFKGKIKGPKDWKDIPKYKNDKFWLHPRHPDYPESRGDKQ